MYKAERDIFKYKDPLMAALFARLVEAKEAFLVQSSELINPFLEKHLQELATYLGPATKPYSTKIKEQQEIIMSFAHQSPALLVKKFAMPLSVETLTLFYERSQQLTTEDIFFALLYVTYAGLTNEKNIPYFCGRVLPSAHLDTRHTETNYQQLAEGLLRNWVLPKTVAAHPAVWLVRTVQVLHENRRRDYVFNKEDSFILLERLFKNS